MYQVLAVHFKPASATAGSSIMAMPLPQWKKKTCYLTE